MQVKCYLAEGLESRLSVMDLMHLALGGQGKDSLVEVVNKPPRSSEIATIEIYPNCALVIAGGRQSILRFLLHHHQEPFIAGTGPLRVAIGRKQRLFHKDTTCCKFIGWRLHPDGDKYDDLTKPSGGQEHVESYRRTFCVKPLELVWPMEALFGVRLKSL